MPILVKKSIIIKQNLDIKPKTGSFSVQNCPFPIKISVNSSQKFDQYQAKFGY